MFPWVEYRRKGLCKPREYTFASRRIFRRGGFIKIDPFQAAVSCMRYENLDRSGPRHTFIPICESANEKRVSAEALFLNPSSDAFSWRVHARAHARPTRATVLSYKWIDTGICLHSFRSACKYQSFFVASSNAISRLLMQLHKIIAMVYNYYYKRVRHL